MSEVLNSTVKRIFYFNIIYSCNSRCVFCYSHNTRYATENYNAISLSSFIEYLNEYKISSSDRVIINGGEPLLHESLNEILCYLVDVGCETLIYTNGRLLNKVNFPRLNNHFRFVVPIHGDAEIHDCITRIKGSYEETVAGMNKLIEEQDCLLDIKIIVNNQLGDKILHCNTSLSFLKDVPFNHAIQITKVANTVVSERNGYKPVTDQLAAECNIILYEKFRRIGLPIKIYDTCIKKFTWLHSTSIKKYPNEIIVFFKDKNQYREINLHAQNRPCFKTCELQKYCLSAVSQYKVLEFMNELIYEELE